MKKKFVRVMALLLAMVMLTACGNSGGSGEAAVETGKGGSQSSADDTAAKSDEEVVVTMGTTTAWESLCPLNRDVDSQVAFMTPVFEQWVTLGTDGSIYPQLFKSWTLSEDGTTLTAQIDPDAKFHDGVKVKASDVVFTYKLMAHPDFDRTMKDYTKYLVGTDDTGLCANFDEFGMKALDEETLEIKVKNPTNELNFFYQFRITLVLPEHLLGDVDPVGLATNEFWEKPVGSGPFKFDSYISGERMEYVANDDYHLGRPDFDRLVIRVIPADNLLSAFMSGEIDITAYGSQMSINDYDLIKQDSNFVTYEAPGFANHHIIVNNETIDATVRKALDSAIDKQSIIDDLMNGYARVAISAIVPENPYRLEGIEGNAYDPEASRQLLKEAGWDGSRSLKIFVSSSNSVGGNMAVLIQQMLADVGVNTEIETYDMATVTGHLFKGEFDLAIMSSASNPFEPSESSFYFQLVPNGWNRITDQSWMDLYNQGLIGTTIEERRGAYDELQQRLVDEVPMIFLFHPDVLFVHSKRLSNIPYENIAIKGWRYWEWEVQ